MKKLLIAVAWFACAGPLFGTSYDPDCLNDAKAFYLTPKNCTVKGDGIADNTSGIQQAINKVQETTNQGILFVPPGRYRLITI